MTGPATTVPHATGIGPWRWLAVTGGIAAWLVHLSALASLAPAACGRAGVEWVMHGLTIGLGALCAWAAVVCWRLVSSAGPGDGPARRTRYLGRFGLLVAVTNLVLIVAEGAFVVMIDPCS